LRPSSRLAVSRVVVVAVALRPRSLGARPNASRAALTSALRDAEVGKRRTAAPSTAVAGATSTRATTAAASRRTSRSYALACRSCSGVGDPHRPQLPFFVRAAWQRNRMRHVYAMFVLWLVFLVGCLTWWSLNAFSDI
jgi:hypothetical protein